MKITKQQLLQICPVASGRIDKYISYINGYVSARGKANGVPTPFNDMVCKVVAEEEAQGIVNKYDEALKNFLPLL